MSGTNSSISRPDAALPRVVIVGAGFGGLWASKTIANAPIGNSRGRTSDEISNSMDRYGPPVGPTTLVTSDLVVHKGQTPSKCYCKVGH